MSQLDQIDEEAELSSVAEAIERIDKAFKNLSKSGLSERALILLISDASGIGKKVVREVMTAIGNLKELYLESD